MKFKLNTAKYFYPEDQAKKLETLGFHMRKSGNCFVAEETTIEFETLEQIVKFSHEWGDLIIGKDVFGEDCITIYDGYIE